jgi:hypothetical protein
VKARLFVFGLLAFSLQLILLAGCAQPNKELWYGTWVTEKGQFQKSVHTPDGMVQDYTLLSDATPVQQVKIRIVNCWTDSEGNTWFKNEGTVLEGPHKNSMPKVQTLERINRSGTLLEVMVRGVADFSPGSYPSKIDPTDPYLYMTFIRAAK